MMPASLSIPDELGRPRSLAAGAAAYELFLPPVTPGAGTLVLGLGPSPDALAAAVHLAAPVSYLECPDFERALPPSARPAVPAEWRRVDLEQALALTATCAVWQYRQNVRLFNSFWGPVLAAILAARLPCPPHSARRVILPGDEHSLLTLEVEAALVRLGCTPLRVPEKDTASVLPRLLREERPLCLLSVNGRGLDGDGMLFRLLEACGIPTGIWLVDNVWQVLSAWRQPWWREAQLFVTDASFVPSLRAHGARRVRHLPLGAWMPQSDRAYDGPPLRPVTFVGRSAFPDKERYFSGLHCEPALLAEAARTARPDFAWWAGRLGLSCFWPGREARQAGFGTETCSREHRAAWLRAAGDMITIFGDAGWHAIVETPHPDIRPPVDYYAGLSAIYAASRYSLNITSLLLPAGLTQRHFDVWSCGGFLLTDATPGLAVFPEELVKPITVRSPDALVATVKRLDKTPALREELAEAWRACLRTGHSMERRMVDALNQLKNFKNFD